MNEATLPPSPNWYLSNILACAKDGTVAWGANTAILIATSEQDKEILEYSIIEDAHLDKVTALAFSPEFGKPDQKLLVSGGSEHIVRIWNLDSLSAVMAYSYLDTQQKVIGVDWSRANPNTVCCVSTDGLLVIWNVHHNVAREITLGKLTATCLSCCPHDPDLVAIGTMNGLVYIVNVHGNGKVIYKLRGHDAAISALTWCPVKTNILTGSDAKDLLLASGAKDRSIFIWRAGGDGRYQIELKLPNSPLDSHQHRSKQGTTTGRWTAVCWVAPKILLSSSNWGELISWDLSTSSKSRPSCKLVHACHARGLFCIANVEVETDTVNSNWRSEDARSNTVWTLSQDCRVVCCNVKPVGSEITYNIPTQGGFTYCIAASPLDTSRVAYGGGNKMLRIWNLCEPHKNTFDITMLWQKLEGRIMAVSWHPEKENLLAFGTGEGRVGVYDTNTSKPPIIFRQYHRRAVYTLEWGPEPNNKNACVLYSCGEGELVYFNLEKPDQEPKSVIKKDCTEFSWKPDRSCLAIGFENGSISLLDRDLNQYGSPIHSLNKAVQCLAWHPESTSTDLDLSPLRHQLAVSTTAYTVTILDLTEFFKDLTSTNGTTITTNEGIPSQKIVAMLNGHTARVVDLAWSPHISGYLASASYDKTVQVWKTESQELVGTYMGHCGPVHSCMWSPVDPDLIMSGSADFTIRIWRLSKQKVKHPIESLTKPKKVRTKKKKPAVEEKVEDLLSDSEQVIVDQSEDNTEKEAGVEYAIIERDLRKDLAIDQAKRKKQKKPSYFPIMAKATNNKELLLNSIVELMESSCQKTAEEQVVTSSNGHAGDINGHQKIDEPPAVSIFGSKEEIFKLLDTEKSVHSKLLQQNTVIELDMWSNNLEKNLQEAAKGKRLNDFLVSLAPSLSFRVWQETCEAYAAQLEFEGNHRKAVSYLLCIHKIDRAIQVFIDGKMFKEAYVLAKCKLDAEDPLVNTLLERWAIGAANEGNSEDAARCYIKLGNYKEAANVLSRRKDSRSLEIAARLALKSGDEEFGVTLAEQAVTQALLKTDYDLADNIIETFPQIQHREVESAALREIDKMFQDCNDEKIWNWLEGNSENCVLKNLANRYPNCDHYYTKLSKNSEAMQASKDKPMLWLEVGRQIAMTTVCPISEKKLYHLVAAVGAVSRYETLHAQESRPVEEVDEKQRNFLMKLLSHLDKESPCSKDSLFFDNKPPIRKSLRAYLCYGIINWLIKSDASKLEPEGRRELVVSLIENIIGDALDKQTARYNVMSPEIRKLEELLAIVMGVSRDVGESDCKPQEEREKIMKRLAEMRSDQGKFLAERLHAPNPVLVYSKALELTKLLLHGEAEEKLTRFLSDTWLNATSQEIVT